MVGEAIGHCAQCARLFERFVTLETEVREYRSAQDLRLGKLNELREQVLSDRAQFLSVAVYQVQHGTLLDKLEDLRSAQTRIVGAGTVLVPLMGMVGAIVGHFWR